MATTEERGVKRRAGSPAEDGEESSKFPKLEGTPVPLDPGNKT